MAKGSGNTRRVSRAQQIANVARSHGTELQSMAEDIARQFGASVTPINFKSVESIERKAKEVGYDDIRDAVRTTIVSDRSQLKSITDELKRRGATVKEQKADEYSGYSGYIAKIKFADGTIGEIQANTPRMIYAKEKPDVAKKIIGEAAHARIAKETGLEGGRGHELYEKIRVLNDTTDLSKKEMYKKQSREYYSHFYS